MRTEQNKSSTPTKNYLRDALKLSKSQTTNAHGNLIGLFEVLHRIEARTNPKQQE